MRRLQQEKFAAVPFDQSSSFHLHERTKQAKTVLVLVHGLNGAGYETWGQLPAHLFDTYEPNIDIGVFDYRTGLRRLLHSTPLSLPAVGQQLAQSIQQLDHETIVLAGHSMGGLVALEALNSMTLAPPGGARQIGNVKSLVMLATPRAGSDMVPRFAPGRDSRYLRRHSTDVGRLLQFAFDYLPQVATPLRSRIRFWSATASADTWVSEFSSKLGVLSGNQKTLTGSHKSIVKPTSADSEVVNWLAMILQEAAAVQPDVIGTADKPTFYSRFVGQSNRSDWEVAYVKAREIFNETSGLTVADIRSAGSKTMPAATFQVFDDVLVSAEGTQRQLVELADQQVTMPGSALGISPYGDGRQAALAVLNLLGHAPSRWIEPSKSLHDLASILQKWLYLTASHMPAAELRRRSRNDEMIDTELDRTRSQFGL